MSAPPEVTLKNLTGHYVLNKGLSGETDPVLALQGIGWLIRKAISMMTVALDIKSYEDAEGKFHIDIDQIGAAGIKGTSELRTIDGNKSDHEDHIFGHVVGATKWAKVSDFSDSNEDEAFLKKDWLDEEIIDNQVESPKNGWTARQVWGFQNVDVNGTTERRYTRNVIVSKKDKTLRLKMIYDYSPKA